MFWLFISNWQPALQILLIRGILLTVKDPVVHLEKKISKNSNANTFCITQMKTVLRYLLDQDIVKS